MPRKSNLTQSQLDELREAYEAWNPFDPEGPSADELAAQHNVSKNTMYTWRNRNWRLDGRDGDGPKGWKPRAHEDPAGEASSNETIRYLTEELVKARIEIEQLKSQLRDG